MSLSPGQILYNRSESPPVIRRDFKPANIKITPQGRAVLVDFGIAKIYDPHLKTTRGARAVTPGSSPPEQYGYGKTDARSDLYALGATLFTLLTRQTPIESVERTVGKTLDLPRSLNPAISPVLEYAVLKSMDLVPDRRFHTYPDRRQPHPRRRRSSLRRIYPAPSEGASMVAGWQVDCLQL